MALLSPAMIVHGNLKSIPTKTLGALPCRLQPMVGPARNYCSENIQLRSDYYVCKTDPLRNLSLCPYFPSQRRIPYLCPRFVVMILVGQYCYEFENTAFECRITRISLYQDNKKTVAGMRRFIKGRIRAQRPAVEPLGRLGRLITTKQCTWFKDEDYTNDYTKPKANHVNNILRK